MSEPNNRENRNSENIIKVFLYNKVNVNGRDDTNYIHQEIQSLIDRITNSKDIMCERRKDVGVGFLFGGNAYADGRVEEFKVIQLLMDVFESYVLGKNYAAVAVAGMAAERLIYDFIEHLPIKFGERTLTNEDKKYLMLLPYRRLLSFLKDLDMLNDNEFQLLDKINVIRNKHVHPKMKDVEQDSTTIVKLLCQLLEGRLSMLKYYDIIDGRFVLKNEYRGQ